MHDDAQLMVAMISMIVERPICLLCVSAKLGIEKTRVIGVAGRIAAVVHLRTDHGDGCGMCDRALGPVWSLKRE